VTTSVPESGGQPTLSDEVVTLRPWRPTDAEAVFVACQDPEIPRFVPVPQPYTRADAEAFVRQSRDESIAGPSAHFAISDAATGVLRGAISRHARTGIPRASIGYWLAPEARGQGVATRAVRLLVDWTFSTTDTIRIEIYTDVENIRSGRVALRAGFESEGVRRAWDLDRGGRQLDAAFYVRIRPT
jgi:RimJ/RimL family protein N-acetyltransferase